MVVGDQTVMKHRSRLRRTNWLLAEMKDLIDDSL